MQGNCGLRQRPTIQRRAGVHHNRRLIQDGSLESRHCSKSRLAGDLPEDVSCQCAAAQDDLRVGADDESSRDLEDPDITRATRKRHIRGYRNPGAPLVDARGEGQPANIPCAQPGKISRPPSGVGVRSLHVAHGGSQIRWSRRRIGGGKYFSDHQR